MADAVTVRSIFLILLLAFAIGFTALGTWQLERRAWKLDLIERVEQRVHAPPVAVPDAAQWVHMSRATDEYRRVTVTGQFLKDQEVLVLAVTRLGSGFWSMMPLVTVKGDIFYINRGFLRPDQRDSYVRTPIPDGDVIVSGFLRMSEPGGGFLRRNDPEARRWYSRDVQAIALAHGLASASVAPYFIDANAGALSDVPIGGLTVVSFYNNHLMYAMTWYALVLMTVVAMGYVLWRPSD